MGVNFIIFGVFMFISDPVSRFDILFDIVLLFIMLSLLSDKKNKLIKMIASYQTED